MDVLNRDDINDITDFDYVQYMYNIDRLMLNEEVVTAIMIGDGRDDGAEGKGYAWSTFVRFGLMMSSTLSILTLTLMLQRKSFRGTGTATSFGTNFIYAEAIIGGSASWS